MSERLDKVPAESELDAATERLADAVASRLGERFEERLDDRPLLRLNAAAARLGISRRTLYSMIERGDLPVVKVASGTQRIEQREIDRYIAARRQTFRLGEAE